ncbi:hypothetical protein F7R20_16185 [Pseudomonas brassicacearum subsp. brassicacearum]|nr:hypothetical protein F7R20_16185 [Pseudomonas brassicacearum subsp. brassicacearum]PJH89117.1 hypothetical protein CVG87_11240 [Pseudomonas sp. WCS365]QEO76527.1 hypothetical protein ELZ14_02780 [Pseudomonas brassicacearum]
MDNFMEHPTYKMNRAGILAQGERRLVHGCNAKPGCVLDQICSNAVSRAQAWARSTSLVLISQSGASGAS